MFNFTRILWIVGIVFFSVSVVCADPPNVTHVMITDVTPVSFSVIWVSDQPSTADIRVFENSDGTNDITEGVFIVPHPVHSGDPSIASMARQMGVMKIQVSGLDSDTVYHFQTITTGIGGDQTLYPPSPPFTEVVTEIEVIRTVFQEAEELLYTNDLVVKDCFLPDGSTPAFGTLLVGDIAGGNYPISAFVGDGVASSKAYLDLNNLFGAESNTNEPSLCGDQIIFTRFMGMEGIVTEEASVPENHQLAQMVTPAQPFCEGDFTPWDGVVDTYDLELFTEVFGDLNNGIDGDLDGDNDVDGFDLLLFSLDFSRDDCPFCP